MKLYSLLRSSTVFVVISDGLIETVPILGLQSKVPITDTISPDRMEFWLTLYEASP